VEASKPSEILGRQLRRWRDERKLTAQGLQDRLAEMGSDLDRRAIAKIETGNRGVSLDEWLQLAHALAVPPPLLFLDLQSGQRVSVAANVYLHPWIVWEWVVGEHAPPVPSERGGALISRVEEFSRAKTAIHLYRAEEEASNAVSDAASAIRQAEYAGDEERLRAARTAHVEGLRALARTLDEMIENGMTPPGKAADRIETIRALGLSRYPDRLVVFQGPADDPEEVDRAHEGRMRPVTEQDAADWNAAVERNRKRRDGS
jgi:transcriptional regulator with XRE-family HTH domain